MTRMDIEYRFTFTDEHRQTGMLRYRQQHPGRHLSGAIKWLVSMPLVLILAAAARDGMVWIAAIFGVILGVLAYSQRIDAWMARRRFRRSPYHNDEIAFSVGEAGIHAVGRNSEVCIGWAPLTKARRFKDGTLLFQGPNLYNWLPDDALVDSNQVPALLDLLREHVKDYRTV